MTCPHLQYRKSDDDQSFDTERAYCTVAARFVQPMRADICTERHGLDPAADCEIYREQAGLGWDEPPAADGAESPTADEAESPTADRDGDE